MKQIILLIAGIIFSLSLYPQNKKTDWNADLDYLIKELSKRHYNFYTVKSKEDFLLGINAIKQETKNLTDLQIALKTQQLIASFGDSHTNLYFRRWLDKNQMLPINVLWVSDGLYILRTTPENEEILGTQLLFVNKIPINTIIDSLSTLITVDNQAIVKTYIPVVLPSLQILEHFGFANTEQVELGLRTETNQNQTYILKPAPMNRDNRISFKPDSVAFCVKNQDLMFTSFYYPEDKIYYMLYNQCWSKELEQKYGNKKKAKTMPSFQEFEDKAFQTLANESVEKIVYDLRYNGGGSSWQGTLFIRKLAKFLETNPNVKVYVVLGRETFSSATLNALDFKELTNAIFVGEETAGKPNHFGELRGFNLPNSKLEVGYSTKYFKNTEENMNTMKPDVEIEMSFRDFTKGIDPVFEWIKQQ